MTLIIADRRRGLVQPRTHHRMMKIAIATLGFPFEATRTLATAPSTAQEESDYEGAKPQLLTLEKKTLVGLTFREHKPHARTPVTVQL